MLRLKNITKKYVTGDLKVEALKGINLSFRASEFVSILGPSGCGKTTLLNIIGGLDKYTSGDLIIGGRSTKEFKERDWDIYRNHRIGFVFQSYNLIPHQSILENVELALTIAGISKEERQKKAKAALDKVGLKGLYKKKPGQLSGGQCQRVAIARSLVNEPDILLADEPTGALDTETSIQIMDLMKEIAKDRLVIMVTHNPDLAIKYSTRIVRLLDGEIIEDTMPFSEAEEIAEVASLAQVRVTNKPEKAKMSWWTAFKLSSKNLLSKTKRSVLTCIAGSIGIVGISAVLAVSSGVSNYIDSMQDDMLSSAPITIAEESYDLTALLGNLSTGQKVDIIKEANTVNVNSLIEYYARMYLSDNSFLVSNSITDEYIEYLKAMPEEYYNVMSFDYGIDIVNNIYTTYTEGNGETTTKSIAAIKETYSNVLEESGYGDTFSSLLSTLSSPLSQSFSNEEYILSQYDILAGDVATEANEVMIVVDDDDELTDLLLAQLGYYTQEEFVNLAKSTTDQSVSTKTKFTYEELLGKTFTYYTNDSVYTYYDNYDAWVYNTTTDQITDSTGSIELQVVGILKAKEDLSYGCLDSGFYYTPALTEYILETSANSAIVQYGLENADENGNFTFGTSSGNYDMVTGLYEIENAIYYSLTYYTDSKENTITSVLYSSSSSSSSLMAAFTGSSSSTTEFGPTLRNLGGVSTPNSISIYPVSFDDKDLVTDYLDAWNNEGDIVVNGVTLSYEERSSVSYTDSLELIITLINGMIDIVTIALICFTSLSLVVSCVMIAIITYVSVMERVKEIGVIRALGGRKKDVSNLFNAETVIIGFSSGMFGIVITYILSAIVNVIVNNSTGIYPIASLPIWQALVMLLVSVLLTAISGFIPARSAAKKDPAVALRTE